MTRVEHEQRLRVEAARLAEVYGPNPQDVGAVDGTEDDYGDLLGEALEHSLGLTVEDLSTEAYDRLQSAADSEATTMIDWLLILEHTADGLGLLDG
jgi:hypothetical protein